MGQLVEWIGYQREERSLLHGFLDCTPNFLENEFSAFDIALVNTFFFLLFAIASILRMKMYIRPSSKNIVSVFSSSVRLVTHASNGMFLQELKILSTVLPGTFQESSKN